MSSAANRINCIHPLDNVSKCEIKIQKYKSMLLPQKNQNKKLKKGDFKEPPSPLYLDPS